MRDDFDQKTKEVLFKRARGRCSNPACRQDTSGAHSDPNKAINTGFAAHISAAAPGGPRYNPALSAAQRKAATNGIWLCGTCAKLIDSDEQKYTVELLQNWKQVAEAGNERKALTVNAPSGLPRAVAFIGRAETLEELLTDLRTGGAVGVFALGGMGGVGKTALAAEAVALLTQEPQSFPAGAIWIACEDLYGEDGLALVWTRVARALGAADIATLSDAETKRAALHILLEHGERLLLALDNVDALEVTPLLETLAVQGHVTLLLTARQAIDLPGLTARSLDTLPDDEAAMLFSQTLSLSSRQPRPTPEDEVELPGLVADLGGLPLALELTATYAGRQGLALTTVREEISHDGIHAAPFMPAQHQAQRALVLRFDRSWQALAQTPQRQRLFAALSLLKGDSFPRAAALALAKAARGKRVTETSAAGDLAALVDYALVETLSGERYRLHPLLRDYAGKRLAANAQAAQNRLGEAMLAFWVAYAEAHPGYDGMDALVAEAAGLLGALEWAHKHAHHQEVIDLTRAMAQAWWIRARRIEELRFYSWAVQAAAALGDPQEQLWAAHQQGVKYRQIGQLSEARQSFEQALTLALELSDLNIEMREVQELAVLDLNTGQVDKARRGFERGLTLALKLGDLNGERIARHHLAVLDSQAGRKDEARQGLEQALDLALRLNDLNAERDERHSLAVLDSQTGREDEARAGYERVLALASQLGNPAAEQVGRHALAVLEADAGRHQEAAVNYERALLLARQLNDPAAESNELRGWGFLLCQQKEMARGCSMIEQSLAISERLSDVYNIGKSHEFLGRAEVQQGNTTEAIAHFREALRCYEQVQSSDAEQVRAWLREMGAVEGVTQVPLMTQIE